MKREHLILGAALGALAGCAGGESRAASSDGPLHDSLSRAVQMCRVVQAAAPLPEEVRETSGLARSARDPDMLWTHNDAGGAPELFAIGGTGALVQRVRVTGAALEDWEDIESGPCGSERCLYIGDIGDNDGEREHVTIYRVREPAPGADASAAAEPLHARYPEGPQDAESLFAGADGALYIVTKGRTGPIRLYRLPAPQQPGTTAELELVRELAPQPRDEADRVTGATASPDGEWVAIRTYSTLRFYRAAELLGGGALDPLEQDLAMAEQAQGESVALANDGAVWLSSEAESKDLKPSWTRLQCSLPAD